MADFRATELSPYAESRFFAGVDYASKFFMNDADVHHTLRKLRR